MNPTVQPTEWKVTRAYAKKMNIQVPDLYPPKPKSEPKGTSNMENTNKPPDPVSSTTTPPSESTPLFEFDEPYGHRCTETTNLSNRQKSIQGHVCTKIHLLNQD